MINHESFFRLQAFKKFWEDEIRLSPNKRFVPLEFRRNIFDMHFTNMMKIREQIMAKKDTTKKKFEWQGYLNVDVPDAKITQLEKFVADDKNVFLEYNQMLVTNYQVKQFFDDYSESIKTTAICYQHDSVNYGYALSAFAEDWYTSLAVLIFKHCILTDKSWYDNATNKIKKFG